MRKSAPFIKRLAVVLAATMLRTSMAGAVSVTPGTLAVLEPSMTRPDMRAAWDGIRSEIYLDPLLLVRAREDVLRKLVDWGKAGEAVRSAYRTSDSITLDRTQELIEEAWTSYYRFDYEKASAVLKMARELLLIPGDSGFRNRLMFEIILLDGIVALAAGDKDYRIKLKQAAAIDPDRELPSEKYSPRIVNLYNGLRDELLEQGKVSLVLEGTPSDATVLIGGEKLEKAAPDEGFRVFPGIHFVEVAAAGYEPWARTIETERFEPARLHFELVPTGPEGEPDDFFLRRLREGDRPYMTLLAGRLEVDYLLIPDPGESALEMWIVDREGRTVEHAVLWKTGDTRESGVQRVSRVLEPLRQEWGRDLTTAGAPLSLPDLNQGLPDDAGAGNGSSGWSRYAIAIGILLLVGAAAAAESGGGTRVEATW